MAKPTQQTATRAGARLWAPFPVRPFLSTYSTEQFARFVRTHVDEPFASKFARFVEIVGMTGANFVSLDDDALQRLCRNELPGLYELQTWKATFKKPTTPHIRDVFDLPPTSPIPCPSSPQSLLGSGSASASDLDTPEWAPDDDSLLSTPESSRFCFEDPSPWTPDVDGEQVEIVEGYYSYGESPYASYQPIPAYRPRHLSGAFDKDDSTPRVSRRSSTTSLRSIAILNFDESSPGQFSPHPIHQVVEDGPDTHSGAHMPPSHWPPDPPDVDPSPVAQKLGAGSCSLQSSGVGFSRVPLPPEIGSGPPPSADSELTLLRSFFFCDVEPSFLRCPSQEQASMAVLEGEPLPASLLLGDDPWNLDLDISRLQQRGVVENAPATLSPTIHTFPAVVVGEAPLSHGMVIVEVDATLARLLNDPHHPVDAFVDAEDHLVITSPIRDPSSSTSSRVSCLVQADDPCATSVYEGWEYEIMTSDLEEDALTSPMASTLLMTPPIDALDIEGGACARPCSPAADPYLVSALSTIGGLRNFHATLGFGANLCDDHPLEQAVGLHTQPSLPPSPTTSDHLPFSTYDLSLPPTPPPPTATSPSYQRYVSSPSVFAQMLSEVLIKNEAITGGSLGLTLGPDLTVLQTPISAVVIDQPFTSSQALSQDIDLFKAEALSACVYATKPKLEIDICYDSLWRDGQLSTLISSIGCGGYHRQDLWPTSASRTPSHSSSFSDISSSLSASTSNISDKDALDIASGDGHQGVETIQHILPFEGYDFDVEGSAISPLLLPHKQPHHSYERFSSPASPSSQSGEITNRVGAVGDPLDSVQTTSSPILTRAIGLFKSLMTPGELIVEGPYTMRIPGTYVSQSGS